MGGSKSKEGSASGSIKSVQKKIVSTPLESFHMGANAEIVNSTAVRFGSTTKVSQSEAWEGYCNSYIRLVLGSEQLQFIVEEYDDLASAAKLLGDSKIAQVVKLVKQALEQTNSLGQVSSKSPALKELTRITKEACQSVQKSTNVQVDVGAMFECLLMSSVRVLRMPIAETLNPPADAPAFAQAVKQFLESPAEDFEGGHQENLYRAIALDVALLANPTGNLMDMENFSGLWSHSNSVIQNIPETNIAAGRFTRTLTAWQQFIFNKDEDLESASHYQGLLLGLRRYIIAEIKNKHFDLSLLAPRSLQIPGVFSLVNFEFNQNLGLGFVSLFPQGFGDPRASIVPTIGVINLQAYLPDGFCKICSFDTAKNLTLSDSVRQDVPLTNAQLEEYLPKVSELINKLAPYYDAGDLEADFEAVVMFESNGRYHIRQKHQSVVKLGSPATFDDYRLYFFTTEQANQGGSISVLVKNLGNQFGVTSDGLLMYFQQHETLGHLFSKLALNYFGADSQQLLDSETVKSLLGGLCFSPNSRVSGLERESLRKRSQGKLSSNTTWKEIQAIMGAGETADPSQVDVVIYLDLVSMNFNELLARDNTDLDLMDWDPAIMGETAKPTLKLSYSSMFNLSLRVQGFTSEECTEWPENKVTSILPSQLIIPFSDVQSIFELPYSFEVDLLAEAAKNLCISHKYKPKAYFYSTFEGNYFVPHVVPETKGKLRGVLRGKEHETERSFLDSRRVIAILLERIVPDL